MGKRQIKRTTWLDDRFDELWAQRGVTSSGLDAIADRVGEDRSGLAPEVLGGLPQSTATMRALYVALTISANASQFLVSHVEKRGKSLNEWPEEMECHGYFAATLAVVRRECATVLEGDLDESAGDEDWYRRRANSAENVARALAVAEQRLEADDLPSRVVRTLVDAYLDEVVAGGGISPLEGLLLEEAFFRVSFLAQFVAGEFFEGFASWHLAVCRGVALQFSIRSRALGDSIAPGKRLSQKQFRELIAEARRTDPALDEIWADRECATRKKRDSKVD